MNGVRFLARAEMFLFLIMYTATFWIKMESSFARDRMAKQKADHSALSSAKINNTFML